MAEKENRVPDNKAGEYYVDRECIDCDLCREVAPENFERNEDEGYSYVYKQPGNDDERTQCEEARDSCPVEAIGSDGQDAAGGADAAGGPDAVGGVEAAGGAEAAGGQDAAGPPKEG